MRINNTQTNYFYGDAVFQGGLSALSGATFTNTVFTSTSALSVINTGIGPALYVAQAAGNYDIASFYDKDGIEILHVGNAPTPGSTGKIGINESFPGAELTVKGAISGSDGITVAGGNSTQWNSVYTTLNSISSIIPDPATTVSAQIGVGTTALNSINFLNTSSAQLLYTVPAGKAFIVTDFSVIIDTVAGGNVSDTSLPMFRLYRSDTLTNAANQVTNQLSLTTPSTLITTNRFYKIGGSITASNGKALVSGNDASPQNRIWFRVDNAGTNTYTGLSGRVLVSGNII
jgi:hypothetical protein